MRKNESAVATLDPVRNPRWHLYERDYIGGPGRLDYIMIDNDWRVRNTFKISDFQRFGDEPDPRNGRVPSDHCGVYVDFEIVPEMISFDEMVRTQYS